MIKCPACGAENPEGTKICVKCGTELPKTEKEKKKSVAAEAAPKSSFRLGDIVRDLVDVLFLLLIIALIGFYFMEESCHWTLPPRFTETEEARIVSNPIFGQPTPVSVPKHHRGHAAHPAASVETSTVESNPEVQFGNAETFYQKGRVQYDKKNYHASFNFLKQALQVDPTYSMAYFALGYLYHHFSMDDAAVRMYEMSLRFNPNHAESINNLAKEFKDAGNYDDALGLYQQAVSLDPSNADFQFNLGDLYLDKNQNEDALQAFQKASTLNPQNPDIYTDLALACEHLGRKQDAEDAWHKVLQYSNQSDYIQQAKQHLTFLQAQS
jgi:Flp pilus assembly protein TadD/ribosomal protein L40E